MGKLKFNVQILNLSKDYFPNYSAKSISGIRLCLYFGDDAIYSDILSTISSSNVLASLLSLPSIFPIKYELNMIAGIASK